MASGRIIAGSMMEEEGPFELSLRPRRLAEYVGQQNVKDNLDVAIQAALKRGEALDHILLYGPPGLGKTTLASVIANEMGARFRATAGPLIQLKGDLTAILTNLEAGDVLFIDEIHRLNPTSKRSSIRRWRITSSISSSDKVQAHARIAWTCVASH
jgi:holliday junction DNA helicase RuvB